MTALRDRMIRELELHRKAPKTIEAYLSAVTQLAQHYHRSPDRISEEEIRDFLHHLITQRRVAYNLSFFSFLLLDCSLSQRYVSPLSIA